jgi:SM-20-related protein
VTAATDRICVAIADEGCAIEADFLPQAAIAALADEARARDAAGEFHAAGVGRGSARMQRSDVRGDRILWLDQGSAGPVQQPFWQALYTLRCALNETLQLASSHRSTTPCTRRAPLSPPPGPVSWPRVFIRRARDFPCAMYLSQDWTSADGGALVPDDETSARRCCR